MLDELYALLKRHYDAISMKDLERFKVLALENDDEGEDETTVADGDEEEEVDILPVARLFNKNHLQQSGQRVHSRHPGRRRRQ